MKERGPQRLAGLLLGGWLLLHTLCFDGVWSLAAAGVLVLGLMLRVLGGPPLRVLSWLLLILVVLMPPTASGPLLPVLGLTALWIASPLLLQPMTARRGMVILLGSIVMLATLALDPTFDFSLAAIILDTGFVLLLAQQVHAPEGAGRGIREMLLRSVGLAVPIAVIVTGVFWIFPTLTHGTDEAMSGFSGSVNPGEITELRMSRRPAFNAIFDAASAVPEAADLYWRGVVLVGNNGLRWSQGARTPAVETTSEHPRIWRYALASQNGAPAVALDLPISGEAPVGLATEVVSSSSPAGDPPNAAVAGGALEVPPQVRGDGRLEELARRVVRPDRSLPENLAALADYLRTGGFTYSLRPGRMASEDVAGFLLDRRKGFCEHYAAACANLLRVGGVPTRVIGGYRGGRWNPWLRTISLQDRDAHAWVEAWDDAARVWRRFDPTEFVAPDLTRQIESLRDEAEWPWYRTASAFLGALLPASRSWTERPGAAGAAALASCGLLIGLIVWLWRSQRARDPVDAALRRLEKYAGRRNMPRNPGETPLAWLRRLESGAPEDLDDLRKIAAVYEECLYARAKDEAARRSALPDLVGRLSVTGARARRSPAG